MDRAEKAAKFQDQGIQWKRVSEIWSNPQLYKDGVEAHDINQGGLGNCYFLAVLGAAAGGKGNGNMIKKRFMNDELNEAGVVMVSMFVNGHEEWVIMDDYLPTINGKPCFVESKQEGEVWPCFLEKAWAKLMGSYARVESGKPVHAAQHLLGVSGRSYEHDDNEDRQKLERKCFEAKKRHFLMFSTSRKNGTPDSQMYGVK